jgi:hypothetical protein
VEARNGPVVRWRSRPDGARREEEGGLCDRLGTRVASGNEPREGARGLGRRGGAACARERVRGRFLVGVPLFELDFLQNFE